MEVSRLLALLILRAKATVHGIWTERKDFPGRLVLGKEYPKTLPGGLALLVRVVCRITGACSVQSGAAI